MVTHSNEQHLNLRPGPPNSGERAGAEPPDAGDERLGQQPAADAAAFVGSPRADGALAGVFFDLEADGAHHGGGVGNGAQVGSAADAESRGHGVQPGAQGIPLVRGHGAVVAPRDAFDLLHFKVAARLEVSVARCDELGARWLGDKGRKA